MPLLHGLLDQFDGAVGHLEAAGFNFVVVAKSPIERVIAFARDRGWKNMRLLSSAGNSFKRDYHAEDEEGQLADDERVPSRRRRHPAFLELGARSTTSEARPGPARAPARSSRCGT